MVPRLPDFVIIGAQRSGSTFLHRCLSEHPDIWMPGDEVPFFESPTFEHSAVEQIAYEAEAKAIGIKRPNYFGKPECPRRIRQYIPEAKLIITLRPPIERAISAYYHYMRTGLLPLEDINTGLPKIMDGKLDGWPRAAEIVEFGLYGKHLERYASHFPPQQFLILSFAVLTEMPVRAAQSIYRFLGVTDLFEPLASLGARFQRGVYSLPRIKFLMMGNDVVFRAQSRGGVIRREELSPEDREFLGALKVFDQQFLAPRFGNSPPPLSSELIDRLQETYREDNEKLRKILGTA